MMGWVINLGARETENQVTEKALNNIFDFLKYKLYLFGAFGQILSLCRKSTIFTSAIEKIFM